MNSTPKKKDLSLDEVLRTAMLKKDKNSSTSAPRNNKTQKINSSGVVKKRAGPASTKISSGQLTIPEMIKNKKEIKKMDMDVCSANEAEYAAFEKPLKNAQMHPEPRTAEEYEMCLSLSESESSEEPRRTSAIQSNSLSNAPSKAIVTSNILLSGPSASSAQHVGVPSHVTESAKTASKNESQTETKLPSMTVKPSPIFIEENEKCNYNSLNSTLKELIGDTFTTKANKKGFRVICHNMDSYKKLLDYLKDNESKVESHTFQNMHERGFRGVIRHLHKLTPVNWIREQLIKLGFQVRFLDAMKNRFNKEPLHLFEVELEKCDKTTINSFLQLKRLGSQEIAVEKMYRQNVAQCHRCQNFGHTKNYCSRPYVCVKCGDPHPSSECTKHKDNIGRCANCKGGHTANYRGCPAYKQAAKLRNWPSLITNIKELIQSQKPSAEQLPPDWTNGHIVSSSKISNRPIKIPQNLSKQTQDYMRKISYAAVVANSPKNQTRKKATQQSNFPKLPEQQSLSQPIPQPREKPMQPKLQHEIHQLEVPHGPPESNYQPRMDLKSSYKNPWQPSGMPKNRSRSTEHTYVETTNRNESYSFINQRIDELAASLARNQEITQSQLMVTSKSITDGLNSLSTSIHLLTNLIAKLMQTFDPSAAQAGKI